MPYVFTEHGITMLAGILKSDKAVKTSLKIVDTFIKMKKFINNNLIEQRYINNLVFEHDKKITELQEVFDKLEEESIKELLINMVNNIVKNNKILG